MSIVTHAMSQYREKVLADLKFLNEVIEENKDCVLDAANTKEFYRNRYRTLPESIRAGASEDEYVAKKVPVSTDSVEILSMYGMMSSAVRGIVMRYKLIRSHDVREIRQALEAYLLDLDGELSQLGVPE